MGRFEHCQVRVPAFNGEGGFILRHRLSCVINTLLAEEAPVGLPEDVDPDRVVYVAVGPWDDVPKNDPAQDYGLVKLRDPHRYRLIAAADADEIADRIFGV